MYTVLKRLGLAEAPKYSSADIGKIASLCRATHVLRGDFVKGGESFVIMAALETPGSGESPMTLRLEARGENDIIPKTDELTRAVKEGLKLGPAQAANEVDKEAGQITTASPKPSGITWKVNGTCTTTDFPRPSLIWKERWS